MYCQSCGAKNSDEAKFCNQCGTRIAAAGEAGGPLAADAASTQPGASSTLEGGAGAPPSPAPAAMPRPNAYHPDTGFGGPSMMSVSLASIGVQSTKKVWLGIALIALTLVGLGWLGAWLARGEPEVVVEAGHAQPDDPFVIGAPLPEGAPPPEVDIVSGSEGAPGSPSGGSSASMGSAGGQGPSPAVEPPPRPTSMVPSMRAGSTSMRSSTMTGGGAAPVEPATMAGGTSTMGTGGDPSGGSSSGGDSSSGGSSSDGSSSGSSATPPTDAPEERDLELDLYSSRVRYVIRRYYANRAQACFDRATRNAPTVSGTVVVSMTIGADGSVSRARTTRNTTGDESLGQCLQAQVSTWRLPPPPGGSLDMQMPFSR